MISKELKQKAIKLRDAGHSYKFIHRKLGISQSTLSSWFSGLPYKPNQYTLDKISNGPKISAQKRIQERIQRTEAIWDSANKQLGKLTDRDLLMLGLGLYMGEGSKTNSIVRFSNSDPDMIRLFMTWMRNHFRVSYQNFALRVHTYPKSDITKIEKYWLSVTSLPQSCLRRTFIDKRVKIARKSGKLPNGTVHITICAAGNPTHGVQLFRLIQGYSKTVSKKFAGIV